jgi:RNA polymerase sigma-32 factor
VLPDSEALEEKVTENEFRNMLNRKIAEFAETLKGKEAFLLQKRLLSENPLTLQEAGEALNISRERARQIEKSVMQKLKAYLKEQFPDFDDLQFTLK